MQIGNNDNNVLSIYENLQKLKAAGAISQEEFDTYKARLIVEAKKRLESLLPEEIA